MEYSEAIKKYNQHIFKPVKRCYDNYINKVDNKTEDVV